VFEHDPVVFIERRRQKTCDVRNIGRYREGRGVTLKIQRPDRFLYLFAVGGADRKAIR